ncbi:winged helix-turn-helix domain-containing protein [Streptacidiphilus sp. ASG 303]|uniref:GntR family transcriptional regulator n=1 Tax=Streptacidiphilus sp. ASG 303 TaxID=2896847 RepID=UPI001E2FA796|nr:winged helix-turn-helix domain-containing protein [Streptacidiphilus sp. ASG 303]MCD0482325.1 winged helix-turn-helix domain-containing protein [Streptacidiphilus sp. ASG 303]
MAEHSGRAMYLQIADEIKRQIRVGELHPGDLLPSEAEIVREHNVSRTVARQAMNRLVEDGYATSHQGKGRFAAEPTGAAAKHTPEYELITASLAAMHQDVRQLGKRLDQLEDLVRHQLRAQ